MRNKSEWPISIDINPTARCNLACTFCWGPDHTIPDSLNTQDWKNVIYNFHRHGTKNIVFTGGEPLIRKDLRELLEYARSLGMRVTLSSNTLLLEKKEDEILPFVNDLGIPLDGSNPTTHTKMRKGNPRSFNTTMAAILRIRSKFPDLSITIRTVVSKQNIMDIPNIGQLLSGLSDHFDRWKLYQFTPISYGKQNVVEHEITDEEFEGLSEVIGAGNLPFNLELYPTKNRTSRYVFIGPEGDIFGVPTDGVTVEVVGNVLESSFQALAPSIISLINSEANSQHAISG